MRNISTPNVTQSRILYALNQVLRKLEKRMHLTHNSTCTLPRASNYREFIDFIGGRKRETVESNDEDFFQYLESALNWGTELADSRIDLCDARIGLVCRHKRRLCKCIKGLHWNRKLGTCAEVKEVFSRKRNGSEKSLSVRKSPLGCRQICPANVDKNYTSCAISKIPGHRDSSVHHVTTHNSSRIGGQKRSYNGWEDADDSFTNDDSYYDLDSGGFPNADQESIVANLYPDDSGIMSYEDYTEDALRQITGLKDTDAFTADIDSGDDRVLNDWNQYRSSKNVVEFEMAAQSYFRQIAVLKIGEACDTRYDRSSVFSGLFALDEAFVSQEEKYEYLYNLSKNYGNCVGELKLCNMFKYISCNKNICGCDASLQLQNDITGSCGIGEKHYCVPPNADYQKLAVKIRNDSRGTPTCQYGLKCVMVNHDIYRCKRLSFEEEEPLSQRSEGTRCRSAYLVITAFGILPFI